MSEKTAPSINDIFDHTTTASEHFTTEAARESNRKEVKDLAEDDYQYFLVGQSSTEGLSEQEYQSCRELMALLRSNFWFGDFIDSQLNLTSHGIRMNPAQLMGELTELQRKWRDEVVSARRVSQWWPEVLAKE